MFRRLLVPLDGSSLAECVLPHTVAMARAFNAEVNLVQVLEQPTGVEAITLIDPLGWQLKKTEADLYLSNVKTRLEKSGLKVEKELLEGRATDQILNFARHKAIDLMILSSHGKYSQGFGNWTVSPTVQEILQQGRTSTLIVRSHRSEPDMEGPLYHRLLVPLDGSLRAESVLPVATVLAESQHSEMLLVQVVSKPEIPRRMPLNGEETQLVAQLIARNMDEGRAYLDQLQSRLPANTRTDLQTGENVASVLQDIVDREQIDVMILSAHGYSGEVRWSHGSITNRFIGEGTTPLLIVQDLASVTLDYVPTENVSRQSGR